MTEQRELTVRIRLTGLTVQQEDAVIAQVKEKLAAVPGTTRPSLEIARASSESVAAAGP